MTKTTQKHKCKVCGEPMTITEDKFAEVDGKVYDLWECSDCGYQQPMRILKMKGAHK